MGWNTGYTIFEETVVGAYDLGKLDKDLLTVLMAPYQNSDIDSGGSRDLEAEDGKNVMEIVVEVWGGDVPVKPDGEYDDDPETWTEYHDALYDAFKLVTDQFDWR